VGATGEAVTLVAGREQRELLHIASRFEINMQERLLPSDEDVETIVAQRVTALLEARLRARDTLQLERMQRFVPLAQSLANNNETPAVIAMLLDDYYQATLHAPPMLSAEDEAIEKESKYLQKRPGKRPAPRKRRRRK